MGTVQKRTAEDVCSDCICVFWKMSFYKKELEFETQSIVRWSERNKHDWFWFKHLGWIS